MRRGQMEGVRTHPSHPLWLRPGVCVCVCVCGETETESVRRCISLTLSAGVWMFFQKYQTEY